MSSREHERQALYSAYASNHAGVAQPNAGGPAFTRDILPHLPDDRAAIVVDLGCGQGELVRQLAAHGYQNSSGIDISPEQVQLAHAAGITTVRLGDFRTALDHSAVDVVTATDFFEHLTRGEALEATRTIGFALKPGGRLIMRVPNGMSPFAGVYQYGDLTHETVYTGRSIQQLASTSGFGRVELFECRPIIHGVKSLGRAAAWRLISGFTKLGYAAETGALRGHVVTANFVAVLHRE